MYMCKKNLPDPIVWEKQAHHIYGTLGVVDGGEFAGVSSGGRLGGNSLSTDRIGMASPKKRKKSDQLFCYCRLIIVYNYKSYFRSVGCLKGGSRQYTITRRELFPL